MKYYRFVDFSGQPFYVMASDPTSAAAQVQKWMVSRGYGATDANSITSGNLSEVGADQVQQGFVINPGQASNQQATTQPVQQLSGSGSGAGAGQGTGTSYDPMQGVSNPESQLGYPEPAYLKGIKDAGFNTEGAFGKALKNRFGLTSSNFGITQALAQGRGEETGGANFEAYSRANAGGGQNIYSRARELFNSLSQRQQLGALSDGVGQGSNSVYSLNSFADPYGLRADATNLARGAAFSKYGGWGAASGPTSQELDDELTKALYANSTQGDTAGVGANQGAGIDWAAILKRRFGL